MDMNHYMRIVQILLETDRIMADIKLPLDTGENETVAAG